MDWTTFADCADSDQLADGGQELAKASYFLPAYELRQATRSLEGLQQALGQASSSVVPKERFSFGSGRARKSRISAEAAPVSAPAAEASPQAVQGQGRDAAGSAQPLLLQEHNKLAAAAQVADSRCAASARWLDPSNHLHCTRKCGCTQPAGASVRMHQQLQVGARQAAPTTPELLVEVQHICWIKSDLPCSNVAVSDCYLLMH